MLQHKHMSISAFCVGDAVVWCLWEFSRFALNISRDILKSVKLYRYSYTHRQQWLTLQSLSMKGFLCQSLHMWFRVVTVSNSCEIYLEIFYWNSHFNFNKPFQLPSQSILLISSFMAITRLPKTVTQHSWPCKITKQMFSQLISLFLFRSTKILYKNKHYIMNK